MLANLPFIHGSPGCWTTRTLTTVIGTLPQILEGIRNPADRSSGADESTFLGTKNTFVALPGLLFVIGETGPKDTCIVPSPLAAFRGRSQER